MSHLYSFCFCSCFMCILCYYLLVVLGVYVLCYWPLGCWYSILKTKQWIEFDLIIFIMRSFVILYLAILKKLHLHKLPRSSVSLVSWIMVVWYLSCYQPASLLEVFSGSVVSPARFQNINLKYTMVIVWIPTYPYLLQSSPILFSYVT